MESRDSVGASIFWSMVPISGERKLGPVPFRSATTIEDGLSAPQTDVLLSSRPRRASRPRRSAEAILQQRSQYPGTVRLRTPGSLPQGVGAPRIVPGLWGELSGHASGMRAAELPCTPAESLRARGARPRDGAKSPRHSQCPGSLDRPGCASKRTALVGCGGRPRRRASRRLATQYPGSVRSQCPGIETC